MIGFVITLFLFGLVAGAIGRLLVPGNPSFGCIGTALLGLAGSLVGGFLGWLLFGTDLDEGALQPAGWFGSILGVVVVLVCLRAFGGARRPRSESESRSSRGR